MPTLKSHSSKTIDYGLIKWVSKHSRNIDNNMIKLLLDYYYNTTTYDYDTSPSQSTTNDDNIEMVNDELQQVPYDADEEKSEPPTESKPPSNRLTISR